MAMAIKPTRIEPWVVWKISSALTPFQIPATPKILIKNFQRRYGLAITDNSPFDPGTNQKLAAEKKISTTSSKCRTKLWSTNKTKKTIAEYPKEKQEQYDNAHKDFLKNELNEYKTKGYVYVKEYKKSNGDIQYQVYKDKKDGSKRKSLDDLSTEEMAQVLSDAQSQATKKAKEKIFQK